MGRAITALTASGSEKFAFPAKPLNTLMLDESEMRSVSGVAKYRLEFAEAL